MRRLLHDASFSVCTFYGKSQTDEKYGANGLPLTLASTKIIGRFQFLKTLEHPNIARYLDISAKRRLFSDQIFVISEYFSRRLDECLLPQSSFIDIDLASISYQLISAIAYLHDQGVVHRCLQTKDIFLLENGDIRISQYGLYHMSGSGVDVSFPVGYPEYLAPEVFALGVHSKDASGPKSDVWSIGIVLLELVTHSRLWSSHTIISIVECLLHIATDVGTSSALERLCTANHLAFPLSDVNSTLIALISSCLISDPSARPSSKDLRQTLASSADFFAPAIEAARRSRVRNECSAIGASRDFTRHVFSYSAAAEETSLPEQSLDITADLFRRTLREESEQACTHPIALRPIDEVYALWKIAGADVETVVSKHGDGERRYTPIRCLPNFVCDECDIFGEEHARETVVDLSVWPLNDNNLRERLESVDPFVFYPCLELRYGAQVSADATSRGGDSFLVDVAKLPTIIKEEDIEYQLQRQILFDRLLSAYPFTRALIWREARVDIPPLYRAFVWAALLDIKGDVVGTYDAIDKETTTPTDRQIDVDVPRCHQYDELLSSPDGHRKLKRVLKAWVVSHPSQVYWQGLDSLAAPFVSLNFNNEPLIYACLSAFVPKYLYNFFLRDNSAVIHEYLAIFSHLIAFFDPELSCHLIDIDFRPELYAIPWFLTMFAHVFPLRKIFHLWDTLLLGNSSFPLFVGVAIMLQLRDSLLANGFNECILLFSDLPETDIQRCVSDSIRLFRSAPRSATYRVHAPPLAVIEQQRRTRASFSSFSLDQSSELGMTSIPADELRAEICPRICAQELMHIAGLTSLALSGGGSTVTAPAGQKDVLVIDIRPRDEFLKGTFPGSINVPYAVAFSSGFHLAPATTERIRVHRGKLIVVVGSRSCSASEFAVQLVRKRYPRVCTLHGGANVFRLAHTDILTVPPSNV